LHYTLSDLVRVTGAKRRSLQLWADAGVIRSSRDTDRAGTGTHRLFSQDEAIVACIIRGFAMHQIAIGELRHISARVREALRPGPHKTDDELIDKEKRAAVIQAAIDGDASWLLTYESWRKDVRASEELPPDWRTVCTVTALKAGKTIPKPLHITEPDGFVAIICLATYLSKLNE
jgi:DNA-binding transcriptional MerR regulator